MMGGAKHRLPIAVSVPGRLAPPARRGGDVALDAKGVVVEEADARHCRGDALLGCLQRPLHGLPAVGPAVITVGQQDRPHH
jgi:hypothetical protein